MSKTSPNLQADRKVLGPYSRALRRGVLGGKVDGRSNEGRYLRDLEAQLTAHIGGHPSTTQRMLIERLARVSLRIELLDQKIAAGDATELDNKILGGLSSQFRLMLREIGLKGASAEPRAPTLAEALAAGRAAQAGDAA